MSTSGESNDERIDVHELQFDPGNVEKWADAWEPMEGSQCHHRPDGNMPGASCLDCGRRHRGLDDGVIVDVLEGEPRFFLNESGKGGSHIMIGPLPDGRFWTIILIESDPVRKVWRPITGWPSAKKEQDAWKKSRH